MTCLAQTTEPGVLCASLDVRGHWEKLSSQGDIVVGISRLSWVGSDWFVWVPEAFGPLGIGFVPGKYWASALLYLPATVIGDDSAVVRLALAGVGFGAELIGRSSTSSASVEASQLLNDTLLTAIDDADERMRETNECTGTIFVDLLGHSRGGPMVTQALRRGFGVRGNYNFEVSTTILDSPDPSGGIGSVVTVFPGRIPSTSTSTGPMSTPLALHEAARALKRAQYRNHRAMDRALADVGTSLAQWDALRCISEAPDSSAHDLAVATFQSDQAFGTLANRLEAQGLIQRTAGKGRRVEHRLTSAGVDIHKAGEKVARDVATHAFARLTRAEVTALHELLVRVGEELD